MFRLINSHLQAYSLQIKSQDAVHTTAQSLVVRFYMFRVPNVAVSRKL